MVWRLEPNAVAGSAELYYGLALQLTDLAAGILVPVYGWAGDWYEFVSGKNKLTGESLTDVDRGIALLGIFTLGVGSKIVKATSKVSKLFRTKHLAKGADEAVDYAEGIYNSAKEIGWGAADLKTLTKSASKIERYGPLQKGILHALPNPSGGTIADTFRSSSYFEVTTKEPVKLYRVWSEGLSEFSPYWSRTKPSGPLQAQLDAALDPSWGNKATKWTEITVPAGEKFYDGAVSDIILRIDGTKIPTGRLLGGGNQVYVNKEIPAGWRTGGGDF